MIAIVLLAIPIAAGAICLVVPQRRVMDLVTVAASIAVLIVAVVLAVSVLNGGPVSAVQRFFYVDALSAVVVLIIGIVAVTTSLFSAGYMRHQTDATVLGRRRIDGYYVLFHAFLLAMLFVPVVNNLGILWMAIEATTLASALLVALNGTHEALEAAWKYVLLGSVGIALALFATVLVYYAGIQVTGQAHASLDWTSLIRIAPRLNPSVMRVVVIFAFLGYGTKVGLAPMHSWLPDAYTEAPVPVSALLSAVLSNLAMYAVIRFFYLSSASLGPTFPSRFLLALGVLSVFVAALFIVRQTDYKRLLAYSSVEQMGLVASGFAFGGSLATYGALLQMLNQAVIKSLMFFAIGTIMLKYGTKDIERITGLLRSSPFAAVTLAVGGFALVGSPPLSTFVSEVAILGGGFARGYWLASLIIVGLVAVIFISFLRYVNHSIFGRRTLVETGAANVWVMTSLAVSLVLIVGLGFYVPGGLDHLLHRAVAVVGAA